MGDYQLNSAGTTVTINPGDVVVACRGEMHGVVNNDHEPLVVVVAIVSPSESGYELV